MIGTTTDQEPVVFKLDYSGRAKYDFEVHAKSSLFLSKISAYLPDDFELQFFSRLLEVESMQIRGVERFLTWFRHEKT